MAAPVINLRFPDINRVLAAAMEVWVDGDTNRTGPSTPEDLQLRLPFIRVMKTGGGRDRLSDSAVVMVDVFAASYSEAESLSERIAQWLCGPPPPVAILDRVEPEISPREMQWGDERIYRFQAQYLVVTRRIRLA